jgi:hypothetical protein
VIGSVFWIWAVVVVITTLLDPNGRGLVDKPAGPIMIDKRRGTASAV